VSAIERQVARDPELDEDRRVIAAATRGPWEARRSDFDAADDSGEPVEAWWVHHDGWLEDEDSELYLFSAADATFVARARTRWPILVEQIEQRRADAAELSAEVARLQREREVLTATIDRLRAKLGGAA
jgi:hypothetical protein